MMTEEQKKLVEDNLDLCHYIAHKCYQKYDHHYRYGLALDDYISICYLGMCKAAMKFDPKVAKFSTFSTVTMINDVRRVFRDGRSSRQKVLVGSSSYDNEAPLPHRGKLTYLDMIADTSDGPEGFLDKAEEVKCLMDMLERKCSENERAVIKKTYFEGRKQPEIGKMLGFSQSYVSRMKDRAQDKLRKAMKEVGYG